MMQHEEMGSRASEVIKFVIEGPATLSLEAFEYQHAIETMSSMRLGFQDVELFLFKPNLSVLLNLIGVLYCIQHPKPLVSLLFFYEFDSSSLKQSLCFFF